jgi:hypothetical protein
MGNFFGDLYPGQTVPVDTLFHTANRTEGYACGMTGSDLWRPISESNLNRYVCVFMCMRGYLCMYAFYACIFICHLLTC